jgi:signal transduction histidine kinase
MTPPAHGDQDDRITALASQVRATIHDVGTPLGVIRMAAYFLETGNPSPEKREEYFQVINQSLDRIDRHLRQLRSTVMTASGESPAEGEPLS